MIRIKICNNDKSAELSLPCKDSEMQYILKRIHAEAEIPPQAFVKEIIHPAALTLL